MSRKNILLIDDEKDFIVALTSLLEDQGYNVLSASNGIDGLQKIKMNAIDLIVLDIMMPKLDGYKVCRMVKFDKKYKSIPIIMLTARAHDEDIKTGKEVGADLYISKPVKPVILLDAIKKLLNG